MIRVYFRQAWIMLKQNRLFSSVYIVGTGLSIALVMVLFVIYYVKAGLSGIQPGPHAGDQNDEIAG